MRIIGMGKRFPWFIFIFGPSSVACADSVNISASAIASTISMVAATSAVPNLHPPASATPFKSEQLRQDTFAPFSTKYAHFEPASFTDLPGWNDDKLTDAWLAFRQSCNALNKKVAWIQPCQRSAHLNAANTNVIHQFFEQEFKLYQIQNTNRTPAGVITGYYEPLLTGSRKYGSPYIIPVYAKPDDMFYLNARSLPPNHGKEILARIEGTDVIPISSSVASHSAVYTLDIGQAFPDIRTKIIRLRIDGDRIIPYYSRREIERSGLSRAKVILWVNNPAAFYSMQIQGSGKVRLPNGKIIRLAYAEQNGHPFLPSLRALPMQESATGKRQVIVTRGITLLASTENDEIIDTENRMLDDSSDETLSEPITRGIKKSHASEKPGTSSEVERMIEALSVHKPHIPANPVSKVEQEKQQPENDIESINAQAMPSPIDGARINTDPSYVFFREIPDNDGGPIGAMGIQLTPGRSIAVDPRTTPLGFPVFIATTHPGKNGTLNRLVLAQDTGGAIRGAVRADYFWGFGEHAFIQASRMKETGKMWLFLPKKQEISANIGNTLLRGARSMEGTTQQLTECVVPDPELCVE